MDNPFFGSHWAQPSRPRFSPTVRGIPVQPVQQNATTKSSPKVVSIPVHFVGSEATRLSSALKIQKVFRGFLVRRSVKRILGIRNEVEEVERRISQTETVELIRIEKRERLRINETLMALLFKLDSVPGVDPGIRYFRKAVIKKAIALQEKVDAIVAVADQAVAEGGDSVSLAEAADLAMDTTDSASCLAESQSSSDQTQGNPLIFVDPGDVSIACPSEGRDILDTLNMEVKTPEVEESVGRLEDTIGDVTKLGDHENSAPDCGKTEAKDVEVIQSKAENCKEMDVTEIGVDSEVKANKEYCDVKEIVDNCNKKKSTSELTGESVETSIRDDCPITSAPSWSLTEEREENASEKLADEVEVQKTQQKQMGDGKTTEFLQAGDDNKRNRELLERMMDDNEKMMSLLTQLFERNEMQTRMLNSLTLRVEQLEKAFVCDRMRRKKKKPAS